MGNIVALKKKNMLNIIRTIQKSEKITKQEMAEITGLTVVTVHNFVTELLNSGICVEAGSTSSNGGRRAVLYKINEDLGYFIGVNISRNHISISVNNVGLEELHMIKTANKIDDIDATLQNICDEIRKTIENIKIPREKLLGIGIILPGQIDHVTGTVLSISFAPKWKNVPIKKVVEAEFDINTVVDNDNNGYIIAAKLLNIISNEKNAVLITIADGVGTGILLDGKVFYGVHSYAGELGHTTVAYNGELCRCGNRGCIETFLNETAIIKKVKGLFSERPPLIKSDDDWSISSIVKLSEYYPEVYSVFEEAAYVISILIDHTIKAYDPGIIILQTNWLGSFPKLVEDIPHKWCTWLKRDKRRIVINPIFNTVDQAASCIVLAQMLNKSADSELIKMILDKVI